MGSKLGFFHFLKFGSLVFREIAYNDSLQQCLTTNRCKTCKKMFWGPKFGPNRAKSGPKLGFLTYFQVWFISFPGNYIEIAQLLVEVKPIKKTLGGANCVQNQDFCHFLKAISLVFLDIAQDCSLRQCLRSSRA